MVEAVQVHRGDLLVRLVLDGAKLVVKRTLEPRFFVRQGAFVGKTRGQIQAQRIDEHVRNDVGDLVLPAILLHLKGLEGFAY